MEKNKIIIIILIIILCILISGITAVVITNGEILNIGNQEKILQVEDLQLNLTGYNYELLSNSTTNAGNINGHSETYSLDGNGDKFTLTIIVTNDITGSGLAGETSTQLSGTLNAIAVIKYINGKYYWIQISGANNEHNTQAYLESIILTQSSAVDATLTSSGTSSSHSSSTSNSESSSDSTIVDYGTVTINGNRYERVYYSDGSYKTYGTKTGMLYENTHDSQPIDREVYDSPL